MAEQMISAVLRKAAEFSNKQDKIDYLKSQDSRPLRNILKGSYDDSVEFNLPKGEPPYRKDDAPAGFEPSNIQKQGYYFKYFFKGGQGDAVPAVRREKMFIDVLESLHPDEAELVLTMKEKKLMGKYNGITPLLISEAFPDLLVKPMANPRTEAAQVRRAAAKANANET
tara:strand:+ start:1955 stop:2461 length:507 start_codon:yes stop_codon:yes gene_type:complete